MSKKENDRACTSCCSSTPSGVVPTDLKLNMPLVAQCQSPRDHPPRCKPQPGQILLVIECGTFFYWGKVLVDQDEDGDIDSTHYEWLPVKCGGCAPVSFRQSQIYFYDCFTGVETVTGPIVDTDCGPAPPKSGDYLIDCATHNVWLYAQDPTTNTCSWLLKENCFGSSLITISKTASAAVYNCTTKKFEINYSVTICNIGDRDFSQVTITDDARAQAATVGLVSPTISFVAPTDLTFVENSFASSSSNILVLEKPLAAYTCKKIDYKITFSTWAQNLDCFSEFVNTATVTKALTTMGKNLANNQVAQTKVILSASNLGGYGAARLEKKFGPGRMNAFNNTITSKVSVTVCNTGATPVTLTSLIDDVQTALGSSAFSQPGVPVAYWICGSGILPTVNNAYDGKTQTNLLSGVFLLSAGQCFAIDFDLEFEKSILSTLTASSPFTNIASLNFTDIFGQTMQCTARDTFYCDKCPQLSVEKSIDYIRFKKERINLFEGDIIKTKTQYEMAYEVSLMVKIMNTGCTTLSNVIPYVNIEDYMTANGVVDNQRGIVLHQKVSILNKFPGLGPNITANASFTGTQNATNSFPNQVIVESNSSLLPGQGFEVSIKYDYIPSNNSRKGIINVPPPSCSEGNTSGSTPALLGNVLIYTQYESVCQNGLQSQTLILPLESRDCPNITLEKETVQLMDLSDRFTHTTDVYFQINAFETPLNQSPTFVAGPTYVPKISPETTTVPPPPTYNCYQATFKYKVTNSGNVPLDEIRICDNFFDQLIQDFNGGGASPFCGYYVVCPPPILVAGPQSGDDGIGSFSGNSSWSGLDSGDSYLGGGNAMLLPGTSIEFSAIVRFCINPKITIRLRNDASVLARGPNESFVQGNSRGFISIIGPSLCFTKSWAPGYPLQIAGQDGYFTGQLLYTVYNDGDRRVLDVQVIDKFTDGVFTITSVDATETAPTPTRERVMPCDVISGESLVNPAWTGLDTTNAVNHPPLPYLDRSELFTVSSPTFTFKVNGINPLAVNTATVNGQVIYDNPALNNNKKLPELRAYSGYSGQGDHLKFGLLCRNSSLNVDPANAARDCGDKIESLNSPPILSTATLVSSSPGNVLYDVTFTKNYENSVNGSSVNVARINFIQITSTSSFPAGVSSQGITFTDPSPIEAGASAILTWTERIKWTGTDFTTNPPALSYLTYDIAAGNNVALNGANCEFIGEIVVLPDPFINCPTTAQAPLVNPATVVSAVPGAVQYDIKYQYLYANGNTKTEFIGVTPTTASYPLGISPVSLTFVDPSPVAANSTVLLQWTERVQWNGATSMDVPPIMPHLNYNLQFTNTAGLNVTCPFDGNVVTLVNPL